MKTGKGSRCRVVIWHLVINWFTYNIMLFVVLYNTSSSFDYTERGAMLAMGIVTVGLGIMQYDIWKGRHDISYRKRQLRRKEDKAMEFSKFDDHSS